MASKIIAYIKIYCISYYRSTQPLPTQEGKGIYLDLCIFNAT